jgi:hypothetical protein
LVFWWSVHSLLTVEHWAGKVSIRAPQKAATNHHIQGPGIQPLLLLKEVLNCSVALLKTVCDFLRRTVTRGIDACPMTTRSVSRSARPADLWPCWYKEKGHLDSFLPISLYYLAFKELKIRENYRASYPLYIQAKSFAQVALKHQFRVQPNKPSTQRSPILYSKFCNNARFDLSHLFMRTRKGPRVPRLPSSEDLNLSLRQEDQDNNIHRRLVLRPRLRIYKPT